MFQTIRGLQDLLPNPRISIPTAPAPTPLPAASLAPKVRFFLPPCLLPPRSWTLEEQVRSCRGLGVPCPGPLSVPAACGPCPCPSVLGDPPQRQGQGHEGCS